MVCDCVLVLAFIVCDLVLGCLIGCTFRLDYGLKVCDVGLFVVYTGFCVFLTVVG